MFKPGSPLRQRPSPAMVVACLALFVALSGGAYAAIAIPSNSVGSTQLKAGAVSNSKLATNAVGTRKVADDAITYTKIAKGEIGHLRVTQSQIQWRVTGKCTAASAVESISDTGSVTCDATLPTDYSTAGLSEPLTSSSIATVLASESVPAGQSDQVTSTPYIQVDGNSTGADDVEVTCEIAVGTTTETRSATFALGTDNEQEAASIPLSVDVPSQTVAASSAVVCVRAYSAATAPTVQASAGIDALQVASVQSTTTPGTSTTTFSLTAPTPATTTTATTG